MIDRNRSRASASRGDSYDSQSSQWSEPPGRLFTRETLDTVVAVGFVLALTALVLTLSRRAPERELQARVAALEATHAQQIEDLHREIRLLKVQVGTLTNEIVRVEQNRGLAAQPRNVPPP